VSAARSCSWGVGGTTLGSLRQVLPPDLPDDAISDDFGEHVDEDG
jgi:hypothetical protein